MAKLLSADLPADLDLVVLFGSRAIRQWADWQRRQQKLAAERSQVLA